MTFLCWPLIRKARPARLHALLLPAIVPAVMAALALYGLSKAWGPLPFTDAILVPSSSLLPLTAALIGQSALLYAAAGKDANRIADCALAHVGLTFIGTVALLALGNGALAFQLVLLAVLGDITLTGAMRTHDAGRKCLADVAALRAAPATTAE